MQLGDLNINNHLIYIFYLFQPIKIGMRPVTRDVFIYMVNVSVLVAIVWDGQVDWYEGMVLAILYVLYFVLMFNSMKLFDMLDRLIARCRSSSSQTGAIKKVNAEIWLQSCHVISTDINLFIY